MGRGEVQALTGMFPHLAGHQRSDTAGKPISNGRRVPTVGSVRHGLDSRTSWSRMRQPKTAPPLTVTSPGTTLLYHVRALIRDQLLKPLMTVCQPKPVTSRSKCKDEDGTLCGPADEGTVFNMRSRGFYFQVCQTWAHPRNAIHWLFWSGVVVFGGPNAQAYVDVPLSSWGAGWKEMETWRGRLLAACGRG